jgi:pimeloyl-ACP methyl ester carboxylesterase
MSDSWISWNPRMEEPSNPKPSSNDASVSCDAGMEKCCMSPGRSQNRRSTTSASALWASDTFGAPGSLRVEPDGDLVLLDAAGLHVPDAPVVDMWARRPPELADLMFADTSQPVYMMMQSFQPDSPPPAEVLIPFYQAQHATARVAWNPYLHNPKLPGRLHRVSCPTLVVWGERDGLIPPPHGERYAELIPGARLERMADTGHLPAVERPTELAAILRGFLQTA